MSKTCTKCGSEKPEAKFALDHKRMQRKSRCISCTSAAAKEWRSRNPDYEKTRYQVDKVGTRERHLIRKYKVSLTDYAQMLGAQNGCCAICLSPEYMQHKGVFHVDHCHGTGAVRGLLCRGCNHVLGHFKDSPVLLERAIEYLASSRKSPNSSDEQS